MSLNLYNLNTITKKQEISHKVNQEYLHIISQYVEKMAYYELCGKYEKIQTFIKAYISDIELYLKKYNMSYPEYIENLKNLCLSILNNSFNENFKINYNLLYATNNEPCYLQMISDCLCIPK